ncbi:hypothetical protein [Devosia nitrariae]|uniref:Uncharacterized protein n=1 Tax=Devosia nitrariae TaxID=2071872 RepID=A0ABQ5W7Y6_9HYPH|nr:hypothetical protein [Devosia nitrariae]GLQ56177.1 hypothetical protein GCM10010862_34360 [Devosia nitrariae]
MDRLDSRPRGIRYTGKPHVLEDVVVSWARGKLAEACTVRGIEFAPATTPHSAEGFAWLDLIHATDHGTLRTLEIDETRLNPSPEAYLARHAAGRISIVASGARGFGYALTEMAAAMRAGQYDFETDRTVEECPAVPVRGIARAFSSVDEDAGWFHDRGFWAEYLDELACQRFNRFHLAFGMQFNYGTIDPGLTDNYLAFAYPFLLDVPGHAVRVDGLTTAERDRNLEALRHIARETRRRGMTFSLGLWTHAYAFPSPTRHRYPIIGISDATHADYCAAAMRKLLAEVPDIDALTFRVHFEAGIREATQDAFWDPIFEAIADAGRPIEVDMHAKGVGPVLLEAARRRGLRVMLSGKYWAEHLGLPYHQTTIRARETARPVPPGETMSSLASYSRLFTRYGYADYLGEDAETDFIFRMWPGTQKLLLWGDPAFAAGYGRCSTFGGSRGVEFCEPLFFKGRKGGRLGARDPYVRNDLRLTGREWHKYRYTYLLWGRLLYNPDAAPETWQRLLRTDYGAAAEAVEAGLGALSRILPLVSVVHGVGGANNLYWPEIYVDLPISAWLHQQHYDKSYEWDNSAPQNWGRVSAFDPAMFYAINEYVRDVVAGTPDARHTPLEVAAWIDEMVAQGEQVIAVLADSTDGNGAQRRRTLIDMAVLVRLGRFFAGKFRAAVDYGLFQETRDRAAIGSAVRQLEAARSAFGEIAEVVDGVYQSDLVFGTELSEHGHWSMRLNAMDDDLRALRFERDGSRTDPEQTFARLSKTLRHKRAQLPWVRHEPRAFLRGAPHKVHLKVRESVDGAVLHARPVDQSARFARFAMTPDGDGFEATIPAEITGAGFPVMYYFELIVNGLGVLYPGFEKTLANQPYFSIHSTVWKDRHRCRTYR